MTATLTATAAPAIACDDCGQVKPVTEINHMGETLVCTACQPVPVETPAVLSIRFAREDCERCGGRGHRPEYAGLYGGQCFKCGRSGKQYTRAGLVAKKRYDAIMKEMDGRTWGDVQVGDRVFEQGRDKWMTVAELGESVGCWQVIDGEKVPFLSVEFVNAKTGINTKPEYPVRIWDRDVFVKACRAVAHLKGAIVENLPTD